MSAGLSTRERRQRNSVEERSIFPQALSYFLHLGELCRPRGTHDQSPEVCWCLRAHELVYNGEAFFTRQVPFDIATATTMMTVLMTMFMMMMKPFSSAKRKPGLRRSQLNP